jgi:regulatory protein
MNVTAIRQQARLKARYSVYVDGGYAFSLSADTLLEEKLYVGYELDVAQLQAFKKLAANDKAYGLALAYAVRRIRSRYEVTDYLRRKGYDEALMHKIMEKLERLGLIDDEKFAEAWVRNRRLLKPVSERRLIQELRRKRVADDIVRQVLARDEADERTVLRELVARKRKQTRYTDNLKLMQYLVRQGFSYDDVKAVLSEDA